MLLGGHVPDGVAVVGTGFCQRARRGATLTQDDGDLTRVARLVDPRVHNPIPGPQLGRSLSISLAGVIRTPLQGSVFTEYGDVHSDFRPSKSQATSYTTSMPLGDSEGA
jgi:hypothetical protein